VFSDAFHELGEVAASDDEDEKGPARPGSVTPASDFGEESLGALDDE
jgi:hypothetical protein